LNLERNNLGFKGAFVVGQSIGSLISLKVLLLSDNQLTDLGVALLAQGFKKYQKVQIISLKNNSIKGDSLHLLLEKLKLQKALKFIQLDQNSAQTKMSLWYSSLGMKGLQSDLGGSQLCSVCKRFCDSGICNWSRKRTFLMARLTFKPLKLL